MSRRITVKVYEADNTTFVGTLGSDRGREWLDDLEDEGSGVIESHLDHADAALLTDGRILRVCIDDVPRWAACEHQLDVTIADPSGRAAGRTVGLAGRGLKALFDLAAVLPELGFGLISPQNRHLGWMSRYYDHSGWGNAVELKQQNDPDPTKPWYGAPKDYPDEDAMWVGPTDGDVPGATPGGGTPGDIYLWGEYTVPVGEGGDYQAATTADDGFELYRDGDLEAAEARVALWGVTRLLRMQLDEGDHFFAAKVTNFDRPDPSTNVVGFILSLAKMLGGGVAVGDVVSRSSSGTKMLAFPADEPGMTAGHIMRVLIEENQDLGWQTGLTLSFTDTLDSDGVAWPDELNVAYPVGTSLSEVMRHLRDSGAAEFAMDPVGLELHAYVRKGTDRTGAGAADEVLVAYAANVHRMAKKHIGPGVNTTISRTAEGRWIMLEDTAAVTAHGRRLGGLAQGSAPSVLAAVFEAGAYFADQANPVDAITDLQVEDADFLDGTVETGDFVNVDDGATTEAYRLHGLRFTEDTAGQPICTPELVLEEP